MIIFGAGCGLNSSSYYNGNGNERPHKKIKTSFLQFFRLPRFNPTCVLSAASLRPALDIQAFRRLLVDKVKTNTALN